MAMSYVQLYFSYREPLAQLTDAQCGRVLRALLDYGAEGTLPAFDGAEAMAFTFLRGNFDRDATSYDEKVAKLRANGQKGGRPRGSKNQKVFSKTKSFQEEEKEEEEEEEKEESSSSISPSEGAADAATTMMTAELVKMYEAHIGSATEYIQRGIQSAVQSLGPDLAKKITETCIDNGAKQWSYLRTAYTKAEEQGITTVEAYQGGHMRAKGAIVDRATPSGNNILARGIGRPLRLKREE